MRRSQRYSMEYGPNYRFQKGRKGLLKDDPTIKISPDAAGLGLGAIAGAALGSYLLKKRKKKTSNVPLPKSKPKFSNIQVPVGKPKQTRKPQTLKNVRTESQTFTKRQRPGRDKKETVKVNVVN